MKPNDETIYNGMEIEKEENPQVVNENKKSDSWKMIGLGSATGILIGAGAIYASTAMATDATETPAQSQSDALSSDTVSASTANDSELNVAHTTPGKSFSEAFAEARAEVGPGGVFHWHGGVYGTYTKDEWDAMSDQERHEFVESARTEYSVDHVKTDQISEEHPQVHVVAHHNPTPDVPQEVNVNIQEYHVHTTDSNGEEDVHIISQVDSDVDVIGDDVAIIDHYVVDGHNAVVVDYLDDDLHDVAIVDANDNMKIDDGEIMDLNTNDLLNTDGTLYSASMDGVDEVSPAPDMVDA
jgi:hypothetical protein